MSEITVRESIRDAIAEEMRSDKKVFLIGEEVGTMTGDSPKPISEWSEHCVSTV